MNIQTISLAKLVTSSANVRKTGARAGIEELAASIAAHGLLQNLQVRPCNGSGKFEVVAGGRRLAALKLLAKSKRIPKGFEVPCNVLGDQDAVEISLAENIIRLPMHPADQFDAFRAMAEDGRGEEEIAARFGCTAAIVRQRLRLASVSPELIALYRAEDMTLDQLMAFTVTDDHKAQIQCWQSLPDWNREPRSIRRALTAAHVEMDDARVVFAGRDAYLAAGGEIVRDLFQPEHEGWLTNAVLLDRLVNARLTREADIVRAEGWKWVEIVPSLDWQVLQAFDRIEGERMPLADEQPGELERLGTEYDALAEDEESNAARLDAIYTRIEALQAGVTVWQPEQIAASGVLIGIGRDGALEIGRGLVRPEDRTVLQSAASADAGESDDICASAKCAGLSGALVEELTAHRTAALRTMLADNPLVALAATVHALALPLFYGSTDHTCLTIRSIETDLTRCGETVESGKAYAAFEARRTDWQQRLPTEAEGLWLWLAAQGMETLTDLLAFCAAASVDAVRKPHDRSGSGRIADAQRLAATLGLDMAEWWEATGASYLARVPKARVLDAVTDACGRQASDNLASLKKDALVARAEVLIAGKRWLPELLRSVS